MNLQQLIEFQVRRRAWAVLFALALPLIGCSNTGAPAENPVHSGPPTTTPTATEQHNPASNTTSDPAKSPASSPSHEPTSPTPQQVSFTLALAGDVNFAERTADLLADPATAFGVAAAELNGADVTMVNVETAITEGGTPAPKSFHFRTPATALTALAAAGIDVASLANNHAADYGEQGVQDTLAAIATSPIPIIGFGADADAAFAPYTKDLGSQRLAIFAASAVRDYTLGNWSAKQSSPGLANAFDDRLAQAVHQAKADGYVVVVYLHWGTEYKSGPDKAQRKLADELAAAGAAAVVGTHAHILQGAGWRPDGVYIAYGLGNYLWWRSFGNNQDDNGVLTLTFTDGRVTAANFSPSHLDDAGIPVPATDGQRERILAQWDEVRQEADLSDTPPAHP